MQKRSCFGACFRQTDSGGFREDVRAMECGEDCHLVHCPNKSVCNAGGLPEWLLDADDGFCYPCNIQFGSTLKRVASLDRCGLCETADEIGGGFLVPGCGHALCVDCFRWCFYVSHMCPGPDFPFPERYDAYCDADGNEWRGLFTVDELPLVTEYRRRDRRVDWLNEEAMMIVASCPCCQHKPVADWKIWGRSCHRARDFRIICDGKGLCDLPAPNTDTTDNLPEWVQALKAHLLDNEPRDGAVHVITGVTDHTRAARAIYIGVPEQTATMVVAVCPRHAGGLWPLSQSADDVGETLQCAPLSAHVSGGCSPWPATGRTRLGWYHVHQRRQCMDDGHARGGHPTPRHTGCRSGCRTSMAQALHVEVALDVDHRIRKPLQPNGGIMKKQHTILFAQQSHTCRPSAV
jgi:hypothetical protein